MVTEAVNLVKTVSAARPIVAPAIKAVVMAYVPVMRHVSTALTTAALAPQDVQTGSAMVAVNPV